MKNLKLITLMMFAMTLAFTSCSDDTDKAAPTIKFAGIEGSSYDFSVNDQAKELVFNVKLAAEAEIKSFDIKMIKSGMATLEEAYDIEGTKKIKKGETAATYNFERTITPNCFVNGTDMFNKIEFIFTLVDKDETKVEKTFTVNLVAPQDEGEELKTEVNGVIYNIHGQQKGAWDLVGDMAKSTSDADADKDMINSTTNPTDFLKGWSANNGTTFVKAPAGMPYAAFATDKTAKDVYAAGSATTTVSNAAQGDIYIVKLRGEENYAVIKVTGITVTDNDNNDKIEFTYKKK